MGKIRLVKFKIGMVLMSVVSIGYSNQKQSVEPQEGSILPLSLSKDSDGSNSVLDSSVLPNRLNIELGSHPHIPFGSQISNDLLWELNNEQSCNKNQTLTTRTSNPFVESDKGGETQTFDSSSFIDKVEKSFSKSDPFACCKGSLPLCWNEWEWRLPKQIQ